MTQHLIDHPATLANCARCGQVTFTGISGGLTTTVDSVPLTVAQEIAARLAGRAVYEIVPYGRRLFLEWRDIVRVRAGRPHPVAALHQCRGARQEPVLATAASSLPDDPPF